MATRLKTVRHAFETLASLTNDTLTTLTQTTIYLPESSKTFRSVTAHVTFDDIITVTGGSLTTKTLGLRLAAVAYSSIANANALANTGENQCFWLTADYTSYFATNWSGSSMTCDFQLRINQSTGTTLGMVNVGVTLDITYEYDDTSTTQIKSVVIPLDAPTGVLPTTGTTYDTVPALDYYLAESGKTYRNIHVVVEGNTANDSLTTDHTLTIAVGAANVTTGNYEGALSSDRRFRYVWEITSAWPSKTATQAFQLSDTIGRNNHPQAYLVVTYEFEADRTSTTLTEALDDSETEIDVTAASNLGTAPFLISVDNEQMLVTSIATNTLTVTREYNGTTAAAHSNGATVSPCATNSIQLLCSGNSGPFGGTTSSDYQRLTTRFYIEEPGPITGGKIACMPEWTSTDDIAGLYMRVGTGSFVSYTDGVLGVCGSIPGMCRNDSAFTLARGLNALTFDIYRTGTNYDRLGFGLSAYWILTYVSSKAAAGHGAHNHTVKKTIETNGTAAANLTTTISAVALGIPESDYYLSNAGIEFISQMAGANSVSPDAFIVRVERLAAEGGVRWDEVIHSRAFTDGEVGPYISRGDATRWFKRWPSDAGLDRVDLETARRWQRFIYATHWANLDIWATYHSVGAFTVAGSITGSGGGTVNCYLHRKSDGELLKSTSRSGNGAYSFDWWDNTETLFVDGYEDGTHTGRSDDGTAAGNP